MALPTKHVFSQGRVVEQLSNAVFQAREGALREHLGM